ncbi:glycosyltransferase [Candidatus Woesearchaeota archaeon]|nr:glycosyltransferase [Candidatus Woesearchaeota archaeon]MBI2130691.1 glycosyltransferase [Candidatus Woesearchaeota archaeon]
MISVIIPTLNEEKYLGKCLEGLKKQSFRDFEIIVVDGKSTDNTVEIAKRYSRVIMSDKRGVGYQQNLGAEYAKGDILIFTHADTILPPNTLLEISRAMARNSIVGGSTTGIFEPIDYRVRVLNLFSPLVQMILKITYAYCIFVRKDAFDKTDGFRNCICEDNEFGQKLKNQGKITILDNCPHYASSRRFRYMGFYSTIWLWMTEYFRIKFGSNTPIEKYPVVR